MRIAAGFFVMLCWGMAPQSWATEPSPPPAPADAAAAPAAEDKVFLARGYKVEMRHGEKYFCRREPQIGSRFEIKSCSTADALRAQQESAQEALRKIQSMNPTNGN